MHATTDTLDHKVVSGTEWLRALAAIFWPKKRS